VYLYSILLSAGNFFGNLFSERPFMPHGFCLDREPGILALHIISDALIALAYYSLPVLLYYIFKKRNEIKFNWFLLLFALFIFACGTTHLFNIITLYHPVYRLDGSIKFLTAIFSLGTAVALAYHIKHILTLPNLKEIQQSKQKLELSNANLAQEIGERIKLEEQLKVTNETLSKLLNERKEELVLAELAKESADAQLHNLTEMLPMVVWTLDLEYKLTYVNAFWKEFSGVDPDFSENTTFSNALFPDDDDRFRACLAERMPSYLPFSVDARYRSKTGEYRWFRVTGKPIFNEKGAPMQWVGAMVDIHDQKLLQIETKKNADEFKVITESIPQMVWKTDPAGILTYMSNGFNDYLGMDVVTSSIGNDNWLKYVHPADLKMAGKKWKYSVETGESYVSQYRFLKAKTGEYRWNLALGNCLRDEDGVIIQWIGTNTDIEEKLQLEISIKKSAEEFINLAEAISQVIWVLEGNGKIIYANKRFYNFLGRRPEELVGTTQEWVKSLHDDDKDARSALWAKAVIDKSEFEMECRLYHAPSQSYRWQLVRACPMVDEAGHIVRWFGTNTDIEDVKKLQSELRIRAEEITLLAETLPQLVWTNDAAGNATFFNKKMLEYLGITSFKEENGKFGDSVHPDDKAFVFAAWLNASEKCIDFEAEYRLANKDRLYKWMLARASCLKDDDGKPTQWFGTLTDIEDKKQMENLLLVVRNDLELRILERTEELQKSNVALITSNQELEQFAYVASHDLKEPLRMINIYTQLISKSLTEEQLIEMREYVDFTLDGVNRMQILINDLLKYGRTGRDNNEKSIVDLNDVVELARGNLMLRIEESETEVIIANTLPSIPGIQSLLIQLFQNLIENAIKFRKSDVKLVIQINLIEDTPGMLHFSVTDNGIGVAQEYAERIFIIFQRLHNRDQYPGTGIGLALCKKIVNLHGGSIWMIGEQGVGSTFHFTLINKSDMVQI